jgi:Uncharacterized protein conserved in bacteria (DUF2252)
MSAVTHGMLPRYLAGVIDGDRAGTVTKAGGTGGWPRGAPSRARGRATVSPRPATPVGHRPPTRWRWWRSRTAPASRPGPGPPRADAGLALHLLPGHGQDHGADLDGTPTAGLQVQLCGDAQLSNFGLFASPERRLLFDLNDFDETLPGTRWRSPSTWARTTSSTGRSPTSPDATRTRTSAATRRSRKRSDPAGGARRRLSMLLPAFSSAVGPRLWRPCLAG